MNGKSSFYTICDKLSVAAISLFALECVLGCSGQWLRFGSISIRMVLFAICFLLTLPNVFRRLRELIRTPSVVFAVLFGIYLLIAAVIGWQNGNNTGFIVADITGCMTLALLPGFLATVCTHKRIVHITDVIFYGSFALGLVTVSLHFFFAFANDLQINAINNWLNDHYMGGFASMAWGMQRIYLRSQIFLQVGLLIGLKKIWDKKGYARWLLYGAEGIIAFACLMSFTRGFWLGFGLSAIFLLALTPAHWKRYLSTAGIALLIVVGMFLLSAVAYRQPVAAKNFIGRFNPNLISGAVIPPSYGDSTSDIPELEDPGDLDADEKAVALRQETLAMLGQKIADKPLFGNGLGTNLDGLRDDGKVEYTYFDVLMKMGIVGSVLFAAVFFLPMYQILKRRFRSMKARQKPDWDSPEMHQLVLLASYFGVVATSYVNPFLLNPMGILLVLLITAAAREIKE